MDLVEFKDKYFTNNFYWVNKKNYKELQKIGIKVGCENTLGEKEIIEWHDNFNNLGFRTYKENNGITRFQKEVFLLHNMKATNYKEMINNYKRLK